MTEYISELPVSRRPPLDLGLIKAGAIEKRAIRGPAFGFKLSLALLSALHLKSLLTLFF
jgi:hypothetical protein